MLKVFLVEDECVVREGLRDCIDWERYGFEFCGDAPDGELALPQIRKLRPDILMDIKMPVMNGLDATKIIRGENKEIPIIMQTAYAFSSDKENAMNAGASEVLVKPITLSILRNTLTKYFPELVW